MSIVQVHVVAYLLFEQAMLGVNVGQKGIERIEVAESLQLIVKIVGYANVILVPGIHCWVWRRWWVGGLVKVNK